MVDCINNFRWLHIFIILKDVQCSETRFSVHEFFIVKFLVTVDFVIYVRSAFRSKRIQKCFMLGGSILLNPPFLWETWPSAPSPGGSAPSPKMLLDWILLPNCFSGITSLRLWIRFSASKISNIVRQPLSYTSFWSIKFFFMDSVSLGIADDQTENWSFLSVEQYKI